MLEKTPQISNNGRNNFSPYFCWRIATVTCQWKKFSLFRFFFSVFIDIRSFSVGFILFLLFHFLFSIFSFYHHFFFLWPKSYCVSGCEDARSLSTHKKGLRETQNICVIILEPKKIGKAHRKLSPIKKNTYESALHLLCWRIN